MNDTFTQLKQMFTDRVRESEPLAPFTTFKVGGPADLFYEAKTVDELVSVVSAARRLSIPVFILGGGTNILIGDKGVRGLVVKNATGSVKVVGMKGQYQGGTQTRSVFVQADSGVIFNKLVRFTAEEGLSGLEMHLGLPGTVGGAVYMNSKWTKPEGYVGDVVYQAEILTPHGKRETVPAKYFRFAYDTSSIQKTGDTLLSVTFRLESKPKEVVWERANESIAYRRESQPQGIKSAGCTFRNVPRAEIISRGLPPQAVSAGFLVDHAGLKGVKIGEAQISPVHANFIVNLGKAMAIDVVQLINRAKDQVKTQFGITLTEEIQLVGEF